MIELLNSYDLIIDKLVCNKAISKKEFLQIIGDDDFNLYIEVAISLGIPIKVEDANIYLNTHDNISKQSLCFVDIETTGSSKMDNIIEIGAIKYENGKIIDKFNSFIYVSNIPDKITELTNIKTNDVLFAPQLREVLESFKLFINDSVFIAHNVNFDFNFINLKLQSLNLPIMKNRKLCTFKLAKKTIQSIKYGLKHLNELLNINHPILHRAFDDAFISLKIFEYSILELPRSLKSIEELILFIDTNI